MIQHINPSKTNKTLSLAVAFVFFISQLLGGAMPSAFANLELRATSGESLQRVEEIIASSDADQTTSSDGSDEELVILEDSLVSLSGDPLMEVSAEDEPSIDESFCNYNAEIDTCDPTATSEPAPVNESTETPEEETELPSEENSTETPAEEPVIVETEETPESPVETTEQTDQTGDDVTPPVEETSEEQAEQPAEENEPSIEPVDETEAVSEDEVIATDTVEDPAVNETQTEEPTAEPVAETREEIEQPVEETPSEDIPAENSDPTSMPPLPIFGNLTSQQVEDMDLNSRIEFVKSQLPGFQVTTKSLHGSEYPVFIIAHRRGFAGSEVTIIIFVHSLEVHNVIYKRNFVTQGLHDVREYGASFIKRPPFLR